MNKVFYLENILEKLDKDYRIIGDKQNITIKDLMPIADANEFSLVWVSPFRRDKNKLVQSTKSRLIITDNSLDFNLFEDSDKCFIIVENPKIQYINIVEELFANKTLFGKHPTAFIHPEAEVHSDTYIGPFSYIGKSIVGAGSVIDGNVFIYDNVRIGKNVKIQAGCVIGAEGLNITKDENEKWIEFPHVGGVTIQDNVRIDVSTHIDRGTLGDTFIGEGCMIDNCVYIAHNAKIGKNTIIIGHSMISGSVNIGENCWLGPSTTIRDMIKIGNNCFTGMGSIIVKDLNDNSRVMGNPARDIDEHKELLNKLKRSL